MKRAVLRLTVLLPLLVALLTLGACASKRAASRVTVAEEELPYEENRRFDHYFLEATRLREKGAYADALALYEHCLTINPRSAATMYELAQFYAFLDQPQRTRRLLEEAASLEKDNFWYRQTLGAFYSSTGETDAAIGVYEQMEQQFPTRSEVQMVLFNLYKEKNDYANVIRILNALEEREGKSEQLSMEKYRCYRQMDDKANAFKEVENLCSEYPNDVRYRVLLADCYLDEDRLEEAHDILRAASDEEPDNPAVQHSLSTYYERTGQDSLLQAMQETLLLNPKFPAQTKVGFMWRIISQTEQKGGDSLRVLGLFDRILAMPQESSGMAMLCYSYMQNKKMDEELTVPILEKVLEVEPDNINARYQLLMQAVRKNDYHEAVRVCRPAILYNPDELPFYYYLGVSHYQTGEHEEALSVLQRGVGQVTAESDRSLVSDIYTLIGDLQHTLGRMEETYEAYDSALVYKPDNMGVLNNYAYFLSLEKQDLDRAEEMSFRTVKAEPKNDTYLDTYAWILFEKGRYAEARIYIDEAMKNGGESSATIVEHCGDIYYMAGEKERALELWRQAAGMEHESPTLEKKIKAGKYVEK